MLKTENLIFENRNGDILISKRHLDTGSDGHAVGKLVEFTQSREDENEWGQLRFYKASAYGHANNGDMITLQLRGVMGQQNLIATSHLRLNELKKICVIAGELAGAVENTELDSLRSTIQDQTEQIASLRLQLKENEQKLHATIEG